MLEQLNPFIGEWDLEVSLPSPDEVARGRCSSGRWTGRSSSARDGHPHTFSGIGRTTSVLLDLSPITREAYIPADRRLALLEVGKCPTGCEARPLFADISGFTPLTEALAGELGPQRGSEELTANLNRVFHAVIAELHRFGGDVIYFSGDAVTCWIEGDDGARAVASSVAMQEAMERSGLIVTPSGTELRLG